jgi:hypothetical protein
MLFVGEITPRKHYKMALEPKGDRKMETRYLNNPNETAIGLVALAENGFKSLARLDDKYIEVTTTEGKTIVRSYYLNKTGGEGHFYLNDIRYKACNFVGSIEEGKKIVEVMVEKPVAAKESRKIEIGAPKEEAPKSPEGPVKHAQFDTIKTCVELDIPVYLVGDAGTGKNHTLLDIAKELELEFYFTNSVQQEYKITGFIDAGGKYHETEFFRAFTKGGLFFLDEIDASIPEVLVLLNAAIANRYFEFPTGKVDAHPDFRVVAAGNTVGSGANELYTGRLVLDSATLDRFTVIEFDYDKNVELSLAKGNTALVNFVRSLRNFCKTNGIRGTFSYRMITNVVKLESAKLPLEQVIKIAVVKGLDNDTIRTLKVQDAGRYYHALEAVKAAVARAV